LIYILIAFIVILALLAVLVLIRTLQFAIPAEPVEQVAGDPVDPQAIAEHLQAAIRCQTVSGYENGNNPSGKTPFVDLHRLLEKQYPLVHQQLQLEKINEYSLLYTWPGSDPDLAPVLFAAHQDVVPVAEDDLTDWQHPPYSGEIADGFIWGRGTLDNKNQMIALLEAVESLLQSGYNPRRTIYLAFGHDEELGGITGAARISTLLAERGIRLTAVLDEGGTIAEGIIPGIKELVAMIGVGEKGYLTLDLQSEADGGHSSMPPAKTAIGSLALAVARLEATPFPVRMGAAQTLFKGIGAAAPFSLRMAFANLWLFGGLAQRRLSANPKTNAVIRTTAAPTVINGGVKDNVLPSRALAKVNFRLMPGDTVADVSEVARMIIKDDSISVQLPKEDVWEATPLSSIDARPYRTLSHAIRQLFDNPPTAPYLVTGATDARYYAAICSQVYRFTPLLMSGKDIERVHGNNERISVDSLARMVQFFIHLIRLWDQAELDQ
jgi:carboxypeptidase PM20D1